MSRHGTFHWNELMTTDPEAAAGFYAALTGCGIATMPMPEGVYRVMMQGDRPVGGIMGMVPGLPPGTPPHWFSYLAVDDVDAACARVRELKGEVRREPWDIPGVGRIAIIIDSTGAALGLITPASS
jgi:predicted enzyme related to lactoylglutathione lyase